MDILQAGWLDTLSPDATLLPVFHKIFLNIYIWICL